MKTLIISTQSKDQIIDITDTLQKEIKNTSIKNAVLFLSALHTTCALTTMDLDPGTDLDFLEVLRKLLPENIQYRHPHDPQHAPDHILSSIIGSSVSIPVENGALVLGTWQRVVLIELDGPREREVAFSLLPSTDV